MAVITQAQAARLIGVSRAAVSNAIWRGQLQKTASNCIDTDNAINAVWLGAHGCVDPDACGEPAPKVRKGETKAKAKAKTPRTQEPETEKARAIGREAMSVSLAHKLADTKLKQAMRRGHEIRNAARTKELIPRVLVQQMMAGLNVALKTNFLDMPRRISAPLHAVMVAEGARAGEAMLGREISNALKRVIDEATKLAGEEK